MSSVAAKQSTSRFQFFRDTIAELRKVVWLSRREEASAPITFLIGGHLGLDPGLQAAAHEQLSLSRLTLTHELSRLLLLEQIYRAFTILKSHPYHLGH